MNTNMHETLSNYYLSNRHYHVIVSFLPFAAPKISPHLFPNIMVSRTHHWSFSGTPPSPNHWELYSSTTRSSIAWLARRRRSVLRMWMLGRAESMLTDSRLAPTIYHIIGVSCCGYLQIRLRIKVKVRRYPAKYDPTPWSVWISVEGVTTPPAPTHHHSFCRTFM